MIEIRRDAPIHAKVSDQPALTITANALGELILIDVL